MQQLLLSKWPDILGAIVVAVCAWYVTSSVYDGRLARQELAYEKKLTTQREDFTKQVNAAQTKTEELNRESNAKMADLERRAADARRLYKQTPCIALRPSASGGSDAKGVQGGYVRQGDGVDAGALIDYFKLAEEVRDSQDICRRQLDDIYATGRK